MPSTAELDLMHTDNLAAHGRSVTVYANPAGSQGTLTGTDASTFSASATITAVCHEARPGFRTAPSGGARIVERVFGFRLVDLVTVCALTDGIPREGRVAIEDPGDNVSEWWWADRVEISGDRGWVNITTTRSTGRRPAEET
jgi:hypothetical protein